MACNTTGVPRRTGTGAHCQPEPHPSQACYYYAMQAWCFVMSDVTEAATSNMCDLWWSTVLWQSMQKFQAAALQVSECPGMSCPIALSRSLFHWAC